MQNRNKTWGNKPGLLYMRFMHRSRRRTYVSATLDIFIQCRSNWVFKNRIWKRYIAVTHCIFIQTCKWSVLTVPLWHCQESNSHQYTHLFLYVLFGVLVDLLWRCVYRTLRMRVIHYTIHRLHGKERERYTNTNTVSVS